MRVEGDGLILEGRRHRVPARALPLRPVQRPLRSAVRARPAAGFGGVKIRFDYDDAGAINVVAVPLEPAVSPIRFVRASD